MPIIEEQIAQARIGALLSIKEAVNAVAKPLRTVIRPWRLG